MADVQKPSVITSTLSMLACWSVVMFTLAGGYVGYHLAHGLDEKTAIAIMAPFTSLLTGFGMSYLTARGRDAHNAEKPPSAP